MGESFKTHIRRKNNGREFQNTYKKKEQWVRVSKHIGEETKMGESFKTHIRRKNNGWEFHNIYKNKGREFQNTYKNNG